MPKYHIWFWPFATSEAEYEEHVKDLEHLYPDGKRTFRFVDAEIKTHAGWRSRIATETNKADMVVTIYVMGHTNINHQEIHSDIDSTKGSSLNALQLATRINWIVAVINANAVLKVKFLNCRSAFARYPRPTCEALAGLCKRDFKGYAYALDIATKVRNPSTGQLEAFKEAFFKTSDTDTTNVKAKDARFEVFPNKQLTQEDGTKLEDFLDALSSVAS